MKYYDETTGEELVPISYKNYMDKGMNKTYDYVLNNEPKNQHEKALRDSLLAERAVKLRREMKDLEKYLPKPPTPTTDDVLSNEDLQDRGIY